MDVGMQRRRKRIEFQLKSSVLEFVIAINSETAADQPFTAQLTLCARKIIVVIHQTLCGPIRVRMHHNAPPFIHVMHVVHDNFEMLLL